LLLLLLLLLLLALTACYCFYQIPPAPAPTPAPAPAPAPVPASPVIEGRIDEAGSCFVSSRVSGRNFIPPSSVFLVYISHRLPRHCPSFFIAVCCFVLNKLSPSVTIYCSSLPVQSLLYFLSDQSSESINPCLIFSFLLPVSQKFTRDDSMISSYTDVACRAGESFSVHHRQL
jgi:hypothetical protein